MKNIIMRMLSFALVLCMILSISLFASADVKNEIKKPVSGESKTNSGADIPGPALIRKYGDDKNIKMPKSNSYLDKVELMYIDAPKGHSVNAYTHSDPNASGAKLMPYAYHGTQFFALAVENGFVCGIYASDKNEFRVAWVDEDHLCYEYTGSSLIVGEYDEAKDYYSYPGGAQWSKLNFTGSHTKYSNVIYHDNAPKKLDGIVIEYQVISRNGKGDVSGVRDVYINDGSGWELVTSYDLDPYNQTVRVWVMFDEPREIKAVATIPQDSDLEGFIFRQTIPELIVEK